MYARFGKRVYDLCIAIVGVVVLMPLMIVVAIAIKVDDGGPIFFIQERVGKNGRVFRLYKFRSMPTNTVSKPSDILGDVEISMVGKVIRRTNIDELPQLINVLLGNMSIVGPRPPLKSQDKLIHLRTISGALTCKPGLTGLAQVRSFDGMTVEEKAGHDAEYSKKYSLLYDTMIMFQTVSYLFKRPPVY